MALWGNKDSKTVAGSVIVTAANSTVDGTGTTFTNFNVGDSLNVGQNDYVITEIEQDLIMKVRAGSTGGTLKGASSNANYVVSEKPLYIASGTVGGDLGNVYGVDTTEMAYANTGDTEADAVPHSGWVLRTEGTGGRAGRVHYETLVASGSISGDAADDTLIPEEN